MNDAKLKTLVKYVGGSTNIYWLYFSTSTLAVYNVYAYNSWTRVIENLALMDDQIVEDQLNKTTYTDVKVIQWVVGPTFRKLPHYSSSVLPAPQSRYIHSFYYYHTK